MGSTCQNKAFKLISPTSLSSFFISVIVTELDLAVVK